MSEGVKRTGVTLLVVLGVLALSLSTAPFLLDAPRFLTGVVSSSQEVETIYLEGKPIRVFIADEPSEWERGLGGKKEFSEAQGMLFIFPEDGSYGIWMKDMYLSIDILWVSAAGEVVYIEEGVSPDTYPNVFRNTEPSRFVLELPAGMAAKYAVSKGSFVGF